MEKDVTLEDIFHDAKDKFKSFLPPQYQKDLINCKSAEAMIDDMSLFIAGITQRRRLDRAMKKVTDFSKLLQPYFEVVGEFVSSHPEYAAIAWGALRLALQLASNYTTFFEKLSDSLRRVTEELPRCHEKYMLSRYHEKYMLSLVGKDLPTGAMKASKKLRSSLCNVYIDMLNYFQAVIGVFIKPDGSPKRLTAVAGSLLWRPFDIRFQDFFTSMKDHFEIFNQEFEIIQLHTEADSRDKDAEERSSAQQERINAEVARNILLEVQAKTSEVNSLLLEQRLNDLVNRAKQWLAPPGYADELEELRRVRLDGTGEWFFRDLLFAKWKDFANKSRKESRSGAEGTLECPMDPVLDTIPSVLPKRGDFQFSLEEDLPEDEPVSLGEGVEEVAPLLWIQGNPGVGKSVLAASTVEYLGFYADNAPVFYFFFREQDPSMRSSVAAFRSILAQILSKHAHSPQIVDTFALAMTSNSSGQPLATQDDLRDLLLLLFDCLGHCFIVLDGLDECQDEVVLLPVLDLIVKNSLCRIILFSRPILRHGVAGNNGEVLQIGLRNQNDIETFLRNNIHALTSKSYFPPHTDEEFILQRLKLGSDGMFLWARLMIGYLELPVLTRTHRIKTIMDVNLPEGLEQMYDRLMAIINSKFRMERHFALLVLSLTTYTVRPLTCREMVEMLKIPSLGENEEGGDYPDLHNTIMMACSGLIERASLNDSRYAKPTSTYRLIHLSAKEYFTSTSATANSRDCTGESPNPYFGAVQTHFHLAIRCLSYLMYHVPSQQLSGVAGRASDPTTLDESFPLLDYATSHWTVHLGLIKDINATFRCIASLPDHQEVWYNECANSLVNFLHHKNVLMVWIESSYASRQAPSFGTVVQWLTMFGIDNRVELQKDSRDFEAYLKILDTEWGSKLRATPGLVWREALAFTPCRLLPEATSMKVKSLICGRPKGKQLFSRHLCKISELTADGRWVVILSIWPSRDFHAAFLEKQQHSDTVIEACSGWVARVEIWPSNMSQGRAADIEIALSGDEIWLQVQQSLVTSSEPWEWKLHFPMSIHPTGLSFTILRTTYRLPSAVQSPKPTTVLVHSTLLPLDYGNAFWSTRFTKTNDASFNKASRWRSPSLYFTAFSPNGRYISITRNIEAHQLEITIFKIALTGVHHLKVSIFRSTKMSIKLGSDWADSFKLAFHPSGPALAFTCGHRAYLWEFGNDISTITQCFARFPKISGLSFSHCGRFLILDDSFGDFPVLRPLSTSADPPDITALQPGTAHSLGLYHRDGLSRNAGSVAQDKLNTSVVRGDTEAITMNPRGIQVTKMNIEHEGIVFKDLDTSRGPSTVELARLPDWPDIAATSIALQLPQSKRETIRMVVNKAERIWYSTSDLPDDHLPAVIERDLPLLTNRVAFGYKRRQEIQDVDLAVNKRRCSSEDN